MWTFINLTAGFTSHSTHLFLADLFLTSAIEQHYCRGCECCHVASERGEADDHRDRIEGSLMPNITLESQAPRSRGRKWVQPYQTASVPGHIFSVNPKVCSGGHNVTTSMWCRSRAGLGSHHSHRHLQEKCWLFTSMERREPVCLWTNNILYWLIPWEVFLVNGKPSGSCIVVMVSLEWDEMSEITWTEIWQVGREAPVADTAPFLSGTGIGKHNSLLRFS